MSTEASDRTPFPRLFRHAGATLVVHDELFDVNTADVEWLRRVGDEEWVVLSKDDRLRYEPDEQRALREAGVRAFVLTNASLTGDEQAHLFTKLLGPISDYAVAHDGPYVVGVYRSTPYLRRLYPK